MRDSPEDAELAAHFREFAHTTRSRAPLYAAMADAVSRIPAVVALLRHAPTTQRLPVLFFACVHDVLLARPDLPLASWYPNLSADRLDPRDPRLPAAIADFAAEHEEELVHLLRSRRTQTNEVGRCAPFVVALGLLATEVGPLAHLDVGASGGLNLLLDRYEYRFDPGGRVGGPSPVVIATGTRGDVPVPPRLPLIDHRLGLDSAPIDVTDVAQARWLEACCWPDQADRFHRLHHAIELARLDPPPLMRGDAVDDLPEALARLGGRSHATVTTSWVLNYFTPEQRAAFLDRLDAIGAERDLSLVSIESPALVPEIVAPDSVDDATLTAVSIWRWRRGGRSVSHVATCHPHGYWLHWR